VESTSKKEHEAEDLRRIKDAEDLIEKTIWEALRNRNHQAELQGYLRARQILEALSKLSPALEKAKNRVLAFCLMRIDDALVSAGDTSESVARMKDALEVAQRSEDQVQIARCLLALGARLASAGSNAEAEEYWGKALSIAEGHAERDMQQIVGWTLITKAHFLTRSGRNEEALKVLQNAERTLEAIDNFAGIANADTLIADIYRALKDERNERRYREKSQRFMEKAKTEEK
jgi:tetratricopeptide (TPR) repeat protein